MDFDFGDYKCIIKNLIGEIIIIVKINMKGIDYNYNIFLIEFVSCYVLFC